MIYRDVSLKCFDIPFYKGIIIVTIPHSKDFVLMRLRPSRPKPSSTGSVLAQEVLLRDDLKYWLISVPYPQSDVEPLASRLGMNGC